MIGFLAHMVQRPEEKGGVSLVLRGSEGGGKGFLASAIGRLFPEHYVASASASTSSAGSMRTHTGTDGVRRRSVWAGDKQGEGMLKHLVTDPELLIEGKFKDGYMVKTSPA